MATGINPRDPRMPADNAGLQDGDLFVVWKATPLVTRSSTPLAIRAYLTERNFVFNPFMQPNVDFQAAGDTEPNLLFTDASADMVGVATNTPAHRLHMKRATDANEIICAENTNAAGTSAAALLRVQASTAVLSMIAHGAARVVSRFGITLGNYSELLTAAGNGLIIGCSNTAPLVFGTNNVERARFDSNGLLLTPGMHNATGNTTTAQTVTSGTYTPTGTGLANITSITNLSGKWKRTGSIVSGIVFATVDPAAANTFTRYAFTLPVASNLAALTDLGGGVGYSTGAAVGNGVVYGDPTNDRAEVAITIDASGHAAQTHIIRFKYEVK